VEVIVTEVATNGVRRCKSPSEVERNGVRVHNERVTVSEVATNGVRR